MRLLRVKPYLKAAHFGPTMIVTAIAFILAVQLWWEGPAYVIAGTVFLGQLLIGWSNDLYDYPDDLQHNRVNKPLVKGSVTVAQLRKAKPKLLCVGIGFDWQKLDDAQWQAQTHDEPLDAMLTESGLVITC